MTLEIDVVTSADLPSEFQYQDLDKCFGYEAADPSNVIFQISFLAGMRGSGRSDGFQCMIVTRNNIRRLPARTKMLVLDPYSWEAFRLEMKRILQECAHEDWESSLVELRRHFEWEYDGYPTIMP